MKQAVDIILWTAGGIITLGGAVAVLVRLLKWHKSRVTTKDVLKAILRCMLVQTWERGCEHGCISIMSRESAEAMYTVYTGMQGNGFVKGLMEDIRAMPREGDANG